MVTWVLSGHKWVYRVFYNSLECLFPIRSEPWIWFHIHLFCFPSCLFVVSHLDSLKHERNELQHLLQNQKFTPADVERINREKRELQQTISSLNKSLEDAEQHKWNEEIALAKVKEKVLYVQLVKRSSNSTIWFSWCLWHMNHDMILWYIFHDISFFLIVEMKLAILCQCLLLPSCSLYRLIIADVFHPVEHILTFDLTCPPSTPHMLFPSIPGGVEASRIPQAGT